MVHGELDLFNQGYPIGLPVVNKTLNDVLHGFYGRLCTAIGLLVTARAHFLLDVK
jgi:hypothetical protein